ncbi:hypothetical protein [Nocardioides mangrovi]|uniref:NfeD-like C-terminal domain-containing protein n=1 Tax=Nocardioides mangrovi TaxID=2874580 RepID=A0ABS7UBN0_9ACTN|nr:hypothetical protein [Nocardioides mangrovi]MBZ5738245.1 hypothetical protein [Nocardioides mangrovi]
MRRGVAAALLLAVLVNLPLVHSTVTGAHVERRGVLVGVTLAIDLLLVLAVLLVVRYGASLRPVEMIALSDVGRCAPGGRFERLDEDRWEVRGEVVEIAPDRVVLDTGGRRVVVHLDGHANPVGHQQPARVEARPL